MAFLKDLYAQEGQVLGEVSVVFDVANDIL